jgi:hypothetical protein
VNERTEEEVKATLRALAPVSYSLRERGYDATLWVERRGDHYTVEVRVRVPPLGVPVEVSSP